MVIHHHDSSITSFGIHIEGEFLIDNLNEWLTRLRIEKGQDLYRSKGILAIKNSPDKYVFQGVHMIMDLDSSSNLGMDLISIYYKRREKELINFVLLERN